MWVHKRMPASDICPRGDTCLPSWYSIQPLARQNVIKTPCGRQSVLLLFIWKLEKRYSELYLSHFCIYEKFFIRHRAKRHSFCLNVYKLYWQLFDQRRCIFQIFFIPGLYFKSMDFVVIACKYLFDVFENS